MNFKDKRKTKKKRAKLVNYNKNNTVTSNNNTKQRNKQTGGYEDRKDTRKNFLGIFKYEQSKEVDKLEDIANKSPLFPGTMPVPDCTIS